MAKVKKAMAGKNVSAGVGGKSPKAPMVDPKGAYTKVQERTLGKMKRGGVIKKAQSGTSANAKKEYEEAYARHKAGREAIGKNNKKALQDLGGSQPYNTNDLAGAHEEAQALRRKAKFGPMKNLKESAKLTFPHIGQQIRGSINKTLGTNYKKGGKLSKKK